MDELLEQIKHVKKISYDLSAMLNKLHGAIAELASKGAEESGGENKPQ